MASASSRRKKAASASSRPKKGPKNLPKVRRPLRFQYKNGSPDVPVRFVGPTGTVRPNYMLVDSGADCIIIPREFGDELDLDLSGPLQKGHGATVKGETFPFVFSKVEKIVVGESASYWVVIKDVEVAVSLLPNFNKYLLGRRGFFDQFEKVEFDQINDYTYLHLLDESQGGAQRP